MASEYDQITAFHYASFRPSLHLPILKECLEGGIQHPSGLDVGCGTGQSSIALTHFCKKVKGVEPSKEMLGKSIQHPRITYSYYNGQYFDYRDSLFDLITFAGSLYYGKSQQLLDEVIRVGKKNSRIIIYDFELSLDMVLQRLNLEPSLGQDSNYDHEVHFNGLNQEHIALEKEFKGNLQLEISISNVSHLLLSSKDNYNLLLESFEKNDLYQTVLQELRSRMNSENMVVDAKTYSTVYRIKK
ncbi:class I SAM-dependent methyltransferase [Ulvibacterium sp.]|uniref:class I SAM-dependent methyltransferase n=1 Tax=Ulvibacterium sp. TaxID=2665914 RepID=UPI003CC511D7